MIKYSVIICTYNRYRYIVETINSILIAINQRVDIEIVIIDNNSTDETINVKEIFKSIINFRYIIEVNQGLSHARNRGLKEAKGEFIVYLDDDIEIVSNYFDVCDIIFSNNSISISGGKVLPFNTSIPNWLPKKYFFLVSLYDEGDRQVKVKYLMGGNFAIRKEAALEVGLYDTSIGRNAASLSGGEEIDYQNRAYKLGYKMYYHPSQTIFHKIENKLNKEYIIKYAFELGSAENIIDNRFFKVKRVMKKFKYLAIIAFYKIIIIFLRKESSLFRLEILKKYGEGYLFVK